MNEYKRLLNTLDYKFNCEAPEFDLNKLPLTS